MFYRGVIKNPNALHVPLSTCILKRQCNSIKQCYTTTKYKVTQWYRTLWNDARYAKRI